MNIPRSFIAFLPIVAALAFADTASAAPVFSKAFAPDTILEAETSTLTFTIDNTGSMTTASDLAFTDNLPAGVTIATPANASESCGEGGSVTADEGTGTISYSGGFVDPGSTCTVTVDVTSFVPGDHVNTSGDLTSSDGNSGTATDTLSVLALSDVGFSKVFSPDTIGPGSTTELVFTIDNSESPTLVTDLAFTDALPAGITIATPASAITDCTGGVLSAPDGGGTISLTGAQLGAFSACSVTVNVVGTATAINVSGILTASDGGSEAAVATLTVDPERPSFSKAFAPSSIPLGATSTLTFTVDNAANAADLGYLQFNDTLPTGMVVATLPNASTDCGSALGVTFTADPGTGVISFLANGFLPNFPVLAAGGICTVSVDVTTTTSGSFHNTSGDLFYTSNQDTAGSATATLDVPVNFLNKVFLDDPATPGDNVTLQFTIQNPSRTAAATGIAFDDLIDPLGSLTGLAPAEALPKAACGGTLDFLSGSLSLTGGSLAAGDSCTFSVVLEVPLNADPGTYTNATGPVTATIDGDGVTGNMAADELTISLAPTLTKEFLSNPVGAGGTTTLRFTITNNSSTSSLDDIAFEDVFDDVLPTASVVPTNPVCNGGTASYTPFIDGSGGSGNLPARFTVAGASLGPAQSCTIEITLDVVTNATSGTYPNATSTISGLLGGEEPVEGVPASDDLVVVGGPSLVKEFTDDPVDPGSTATLVFTLTHPIAAPAPGDPPVPDITGIAFTDDLEAALSGLLATGLPASACGGTVSTPNGGMTIEFAGGTLTAGEACSFSVILSVPGTAAAGPHTNSTSNVVANVGGIAVTANPASDDLLISGLTLSKEFLDDPVLPEDTVTLRFTLDNIHPTDDATAIFFIDNLGGATGALPGLAAEAPLPDTSSCGLGSTLSGTTSLVFTGGSLNAGTSCSFDVIVLVPSGAEDGIYNNVTSPVSATLGGASFTGDPARDLLTVDSNLLFLTKEFTNDPVAPGGSVTLEFNLTNQAAEAVSGLTFDDDLDATLAGLVSTSGTLADVCGAGSEITGTGLLEFTGGSLPAGGSCTFSVTLAVPADVPIGTTFPNTTSEVSGMTNGEVPVVGDPARDDLRVDFLDFSKSFSGPAIADGFVTLSFTIQNLSTVSGAAGLGFSDDLDAVIPGLTATGLPMSDVCGTGSVLAGTSLLTLSGGNLLPGGSCIFNVTLQIPSTAVSGAFPNSTSDLFQVGLAVASPATADLTIVSPAIDVEKATNGVDADAAPGPSILEGDPVAWTYVVTNNGDVALTGVAVSDDQGVTVTCPQSTLAVTESMTCSATGVSVVGQYQNLGTASAISAPDDFPVEDSDPSHYLGIARGTIIVQKVTDPSGGTGFGFTDDIDDPGSFTLDDGQSQTFLSVAPGTYTVTESLVSAGWDLSAITCDDANSSGDVGTATATINLEAGETVTCSFSNSQRGSIVIQKATSPAGGTGFGFTDDIDDPGSFALDDGQSQTFLSVAPGTYTVTEDLAVGWGLSAITCVDPSGGSVADPATRTAAIDLAPGESVVCTFENTMAAIEITKTPLVSPVSSGSTASFTIGLRNQGLVDLANLRVSDPLTPDCDRAAGSLPALPPGGSTSYTCETVPLFANLTNQATVTADVPEGPPVSASASALVEVIDPTLEITKTPAVQQILAGETATFSITLTNVGDDGLTSVAVSDPQTPDCERTVGLPDLGPGQSISYACTTEPLGVDLVNVATVSAVNRAGQQVSASASAMVDVILPIEIVKSPSEQEILPGETATFTITLSNPGSVEKTNVLVSDPLTPACETMLASLAPGEIISYNCTTDPLSGDLTNVATVTAETPSGTVTARSTALVRVVDPPIEITKQPVGQVVDPGDVASFTITVNNPGTAALSGISVVDPLTPACAAMLPDIPAGGQASYTCDSDPLAASFTNVATVTATAAGIPVSASASAEVSVREPIVIDKAPAEQSVPFGTAATFTITLRNEGMDVKTDVAVSDPLTPDCERAAGELGDLAPNGGSLTYTCTTDALTQDLINQATVTAIGAEGPVGASDSALVDVLTDILISKTPQLQQVEAGLAATFTISVSNGGNEVLTGVAVADPATPDCARDLGVLNPGQSTSYDCTTEPLFADLTNVASAVGQISGGPVTATASAQVDVFLPIEIAKAPAEQQILGGESAAFTIALSNPSDVTWTQVAVSDPLTPDCDRPAGLLPDLAPGAATSYTCSTGPLFANLTNEATVTAEGPAGSVSAAANAFVLVLDPVIGITKEPAAQLVSPGAPASFTITLSNPGPGALTGVAVSDPLTPDCDRAPGLLPDLPAGTSTSYVCASGPVFADFVNVATVTASSPTGVTAGASASALVNVVNPIEIVKGPLEQTVPEGAQASFTITLSNDDDSVKANVRVLDPATPDCARAPGEIPDLQPNGGSFSYTCQTAPLFADLVNQATVVADSPQGEVTASASAAVTVTALPGIAVTKTAVPASLPEPGGSVTFTVRVDNTSGVEAVTLLSLLDDIHGDLSGQGDCAVPQAIAAGAFYQCSFTASVTGDAGTSETDTVTASAVDAESNAITGQDSATVVVTDVQPAIAVLKTANPSSLPEPGGSVVFTVRVDNASAVEGATLVSLLDDVHGDLDGQGDCAVPQALAASGSYQCSFTASVTGNAGDSVTDTVLATAEDNEGNSVTAQGSATVLITDVQPTIAVTKTATPSSLPEPGGDVVFTVRVDNASAVEAVTLLSVFDDIHGDLNGQGDCAVPQAIAAGGFYQCSFAANVTGDANYSETDTVIASAQDGESNVVVAQASATVNITDVLPTIVVTKSASPDSLPEPGGVVAFSVRVGNTGAAEALTLLSLFDDVYGDLNGQGDCAVPQAIAAGGFYQCSFNASVSGDAGDSVTDTVTARAQDNDGNAASAQASATVSITEVFGPDLVLRIDPTQPAANVQSKALVPPPEQQHLQVGDTLICDLVYNNQGNRDASGVMLESSVPDGTRFNPAASNPGWDCGLGFPGEVCILNVGVLGIGEAGNALLALQLGAGVGTTLTLSARISDDGTQGDDLNPLDNEATKLIVIGPGGGPGGPPVQIPALQFFGLVLLSLLLGLIGLSSAGRRRS